ncbi:hypothetical protein CEUSTIGMA_g10411.t1 [Chlamydomonas eustigma]|uniref:Uncharacterized protein n=1 Tax=Chlamydomonas eustigma TaxID=1157962 RepID=A0A250XIS8_9CHLO|nr:hypothetical protein CEUSTIGMA_g10411.t1 [Chlamydomonas eustigma]|eukprot:GAX82984.1 hypothetical protein CEUSTIGMA_g10411.t1 [Chlamydomonas eustigma]
MWELHAVFLAFLLVPATCVQAGSQEWCSVVSSIDFPEFSHLFECASVPPFMLGYLWSPVLLSINCSATKHSIYKGDSKDLLRTNLDGAVSAYCGIENFLFDRRKCSFQMSPFWPTYVGIKEGQGCSLKSHVEFSPSMMLSGILGITMFYLAPFLVASLFFRLSCGTAMFTTGSLIILIFLLMRVVPHKRKVAVALSITGSTGMAVLRWFTGQWLPSWAQLSQNPFFQAYLAASVLVGAALTYWFDDRRNPKLNTLILVALRIGSLALVYFSTWMMPLAFAGVISVLLTSLASPSVQENMQRTGRQVHRVVDATSTLLLSPFKATSTTTPTPHVVASRPPAAVVSGGRGVKATGSNVRNHGTEEGEVPASAPSVAAGFAFWTGSGSRGTTSQQQKKHLQLQEHEELLRRRALLGLPVDDEDDVKMLTPVHLKSPPPDPWSLEKVTHAYTFEEKYTEAILHQQVVAKSRPGSKSPAAQKIGSGRRVASSRGAAAAQSLQPGEGDLSQAPSSAGVAAGSTLDCLDEKVQHGLIFNPLSGRNIKIGGDTYLRLLDHGWVPDKRRGVMVAVSTGEDAPGGGNTSNVPLGKGSKLARPR